MTAAAAVREARRSGVSLRLVDGKARVAGDAPAAILAALRAHKGEVVELLRGDRCRMCDIALAWPKAAGIVFADGTAECMRCCDDEVERLLASGRRAVDPNLAHDPAELTLRGEADA